MTLDLVRLAERIDQLVDTLESESRLRQARLQRARRLLSSVESDEMLGQIDAARNSTWLIAAPIEPPDSRHTASSVRDGYAVLATDGSSMDVDRHGPCACYLINIGHARLRYREATADLGNEPDLHFASDRLLLADRSNASKESVMTGNLLDAYRMAREMLRLADLAEDQSAERPLVALLDGQFVIWGLKESELSSEARDAIFDQGVLEALDRLRRRSAAGGFALGSYISRPASREVTNALRITACPVEPAPNCLQCPRRPDRSRPCDDVAGGVDAHLFAGYLAEGERSATFRRVSRSSDLHHTDDRYAQRHHSLRFFYLRVPGGEVARVEFPEWVAEDAGAVDLLHAVVLDQCARGAGYPVVLQEAHEQAVIAGADRRSFAALIEREMERRGLQPQISAKARSKQQRRI